MNTVGNVKLVMVQSMFVIIPDMQRQLVSVIKWLTTNTIAMSSISILMSKSLGNIAKLFSLT